MRRCHYCGKILHELPFTCRRCGHIYCSDHHLPENHHCHGHRHYNEHKPRHRLCENCGRELTGLPFTCNRCGMFLCVNCHLPENHGCVVIPVPPKKPRPSKLTINKRPLVNAWKRFKSELTLKNFTIVSLALMGIAFLPVIFPLENYLDLFASFLLIGVLCFLIAYFLYAVKCWGADGHIGSVLMLTIPLLVYFVASSNLQEATDNVLFSLFIQFCFFAIISALVLYVMDKVKDWIDGHLFRKGRRYTYFSPDLTYAVVGALLFSFFTLNLGSVAIFSENINLLSGSLPEISNSEMQYNTPSIPTTYRVSQTAIPVYTPTISSIQFTTPEQSRRSLEYINSIRSSNGVNTISFDSRVYNIGLARVNDMDEYGYLDHTNPYTGTCPDSIKIQYGLSTYEYVAENAYGFPSGGSYSSGMENRAVDSWMNSRGHRYNLLYPHTAGAAVCSSGGHCVFLGLNKDRFGEGCYTAAQGSALWNSVGKQPYEI